MDYYPTSFMVSCDTGISKTQDYNLSLLKILIVLRFLFSLFHFVWYCLYINSQVSFVILKTSIDVKGEKAPREKNLSIPDLEWDILRKNRKVPLCS